jgi:hypothetical protein
MLERSEIQNVTKVYEAMSDRAAIAHIVAKISNDKIPIAAFDTNLYQIKSGNTFYLVNLNGNTLYHVNV